MERVKTESFKSSQSQQILTPIFRWISRTSRNFYDISKINFIGLVLLQPPLPISTWARWRESTGNRVADIQGLGARRVYSDGGRFMGCPTLVGFEEGYPMQGVRGAHAAEVYNGVGGCIYFVVGSQWCCWRRAEVYSTLLHMIPLHVP